MEWAVISDYIYHGLAKWLKQAKIDVSKIKRTYVLGVTFAKTTTGISSLENKRMKKNILLACWALSLSILASCEEETISVGPEQMLRGQEYFPLEVGRYTEYSVRQVNHKELIEDEYLQFFIRHEITEASAEGADSVFRIERFRKPTLIDDWEADSVWTVRREGNRIVQVESNVPFVKLIFPLQTPLTWDGNAYNIMPQEDYSLEKVDSAYSLNGFEFERAATVVHKDAYTLIDQDIREEVYAAGVGLVYRKRETYSFINDSQSPFYAKDSIISGIFYEEVLLDYGEQ